MTLDDAARRVLARGERPNAVVLSPERADFLRRLELVHMERRIAVLALGKRPAPWRPFARRRWDHAVEQIDARLDNQIAQLWREVGGG